MTESEWRTDIHPGYRTKIIRTPYGTAEINRPILTPEEQAKREETVIQALKGFAKERSKACYIVTAVLTLGMCLAGVLSWQGAMSLLIIIPLMVNTVFLSLGIPQLLRKSVIFTSSFVLLYNVFVFSIGGILNEAVSIISSIIGIIRFRKAKKG